MLLHNLFLVLCFFCGWHITNGQEATDCKTTAKGEDYRGQISVTRSGKTCRAWSESVHPYNNPSNKPLAGLISNFCRNPDSSTEPWCYHDGNKWDYCNVPSCITRPSPTPVTELGALFQELKNIALESKAQNQALKTLILESKAEVQALKTIALESKAQVQVMKSVESESKAQVQIMKTVVLESKAQNQALKSLESESKTEVQVLKSLESESKTQVQALKSLESESKTEVQVLKTTELESKAQAKSLKSLVLHSKLSFVNAGMIMLKPYGSSLYLITTGGTPAYKDQRQKCLAAGGDLASAETWAEWEHLYEEVLRVKPTGYWIGGSCSNGSPYKWLTGSVMTEDSKRAFSSGQNTPCSSDAERLILAHIGSGNSVTNSWHSDAAARSSYQAICEFSDL